MIPPGTGIMIMATDHVEVLRSVIPQRPRYKPDFVQSV